MNRFYSLILIPSIMVFTGCSGVVDLDNRGLACQDETDCDVGQKCVEGACVTPATANTTPDLSDTSDSADPTDATDSSDVSDASDESDPSTPSLCGNGTLDDGELCDDGYADACGTCNADCTAVGSGAACGDGEACPELETCDDGYTDACGSCNADCSAVGSGATCGDGEICPELEACEPSEDDVVSEEGCGGCNDDCTGPGAGICGDGIICEGQEACDDGYTDACGSCNADCSGPGDEPVCGDGNLCPELETCDDGYADACGSCNADCTGSGVANVCGNGQLCPELEACDDGYTDACGTCNANCSAAGSGSTCGDNTICPELETCDDGFADGCGSCNANCTGSGSGSTCGDGIACLETEACDDGFLDACGTCNADCSGPGNSATCGDGSICPEFELCDDGYTDMCGDCNSTCNAQGSGAICGDGFTCPQIETCDDGYADACGTCNASCSGSGSGASCGDGQFCPELEVCDDGNNNDDDGCTNTCTNGLCGDGLYNQRLLAVTSMTFSWAGIRCGGNDSQAVFSVNGVEFARAQMANACYCGDVDQSITVTDASLFGLLNDGSNTYAFRMDPIDDTYVYWVKATIDDTGEQVILYEQDAGTASFSAAIPCGSGIGQVSPQINSSAEVFGPEECDDGNNIDGDGCDSNCTFSACGNGIAAGSESCDTGGESSGCDDDCSFVQCGDGNPNAAAGELCDDGNLTNDDGCSDTCQLEYCGDGNTQDSLGEVCDDGNQNNGDGCSFGCQVEICGDANINASLGEVCDDGNTNNDDGCSSSCAVECGDNTVASTGVASSAKLKWHRSGYQCTADQASEMWVYVDGEQLATVPISASPCGDYESVIDSPKLVNTLNAGTHTVEVVVIGCWIAAWVDLELTLEAGGTRSIPLFDPFNHNENGISCTDFEFLSNSSATVYGEACDDGNTTSGDGCSNTCGIESCGNGVLDLGEMCDDGNSSSGDGCSNACEQEGCGDGVQSATEECDDGNSSNGDGCSEECLAEVCGNGRLDPEEDCDDDNLVSGDGCSSLCTTEDCGNGIREVGEGCDDGNLEAGDGCSSICQIEDCTNVADSDGDGLADCVETNTGVYVSTANTGTSADDPDSDDDGIPDGDEVLGTSGGLNLRGFGANPNHRDIFLEVDWTRDDAASNCGGSELRPTANAMTALVEAFAAAPTQNRDGTTGIALHVDYGQGSGFDGGNFISEADSFLNGGLIGDFVDHKSVNFASNREGYFHYVIQAYDFGNGGVSSGAGGLGYAPGFDFLVTQGCPKDGDVTTYMHELGHNLNLLHGGFEDCNYKPNYNSVMNYLYNYAFRDCGRNVQADLTYSRGVLADLNENSLNESLGVCEDVAIDWNVDGSIGVIQYNVNSEESSQEQSCGGTFTVLKDHDDWTNLVYLGPSTSEFMFPLRIRE